MWKINKTCLNIWVVLFKVSLLMTYFLKLFAESWNIMNRLDKAVWVNAVVQYFFMCSYHYYNVVMCFKLTIIKYGNQVKF